jgi:hypothetical protein
MKLFLSRMMIAAITVVLPQMMCAQAPTLGSLTGFALFTKVGALSNIGTSNITGDVGTNSGSMTGFTAGMINGNTYIVDAATAQAATDVTAAYNFLSGVTCGTAISIGLGGGQILTPSVYCISGASTLTGDLTLNAQGNPNALFIIKIEGALSASTLSNVILLNGASLSNVYWQIQGAFELGASAVFRGNLITSGAISLSESAVLQGRGLTIEGAISTNTSTVIKPVEAVLPIQLCAFTATQKEQNVLLEWQTASEKNSAYLELQKSVDATTFAPIARMKAAGTTIIKQFYNYVDAAPSTDNISYYRLKQGDLNGQFVYSKVVSIEKALNTIFIYPNPALNQLTIKNMSDAQNFSVTNLLGQTVLVGKYGSDSTLDISSLEIGAYFFKTNDVKIKFFKN